MESRRNVHAAVEGIFVQADVEVDKQPYAIINYKPFDCDYFFDEWTHEKVNHTEVAHCVDKRVHCYDPSVLDLSQGRVGYGLV